jgi:hypothetical protein
MQQLEKVRDQSSKSSSEKHGGRRHGAGRKAGVPNKLSGDLKAMILDALGREGGVAYLQEVAQTDTKAFCALLGRVLPMTVVGDKDNPVSLTITWGKPE